MTDHSTPEPNVPREPPDNGTTAAEDELVSAVLDGEASATERDVVHGDARLRARLESFTRARNAVSAMPQVADETRDASIARAVDASSVSATASHGDAAAPAFLAVERARRRRQIRTIIAAAAVLLVAVPLLAIALTGRGREQNMAATGATDSNESEARSGGAAADAAPSSTTVRPELDQTLRTVSSPVFVGDLGAIATPSQLRAEVENALTDAQLSLGVQRSGPQSTTTAPLQQENFAAGDPALDACATTLASADPTLGLPVLTATMRWNGEPSIVVVFRTAVPSTLPGQPDELADVIVVARPDCTTIGRFVA